MSAPNLKEVEWAISELEQEESSFSVYQKLAALYTVRDKMKGANTPMPQQEPHAYSAAAKSDKVALYGDSDFLRAVNGKAPEKVWLIMDELMEALQVVNRKAYDNVIQKLKRL